MRNAGLYIVSRDDLCRENTIFGSLYQSKKANESAFNLKRVHRLEQLAFELAPTSSNLIKPLLTTHENKSVEFEFSCSSGKIIYCYKIKQNRYVFLDYHLSRPTGGGQAIREHTTASSRLLGTPVFADHVSGQGRWAASLFKRLCARISQVARGFVGINKPRRPDYSDLKAMLDDCLSLSGQSGVPKWSALYCHSHSPGSVSTLAPAAVLYGEALTLACVEIAKLIHLTKAEETMAVHDFLGETNTITPYNKSGGCRDYHFSKLSSWFGVKSPQARREYVVQLLNKLRRDNDHAVRAIVLMLSCIHVNESIQRVNRCDTTSNGVDSNAQGLELVRKYHLIGQLAAFTQLVPGPSEEQLLDPVTCLENDDARFRTALEEALHRLCTYVAEVNPIALSACSFVDQYEEVGDDVLKNLRRLVLEIYKDT